jgi:hypothetical protein
LEWHPPPPFPNYRRSPVPLLKLLVSKSHIESLLSYHYNVFFVLPFSCLAFALKMFRDL